MARTKNYIEKEVIEKAMHLFWRNGYEATSVRMLEKEMGINQFSIYSSFGNKNGVYVESLKCYKKKLISIVEKMRNSPKGIEALKDYFYDFLTFSKENAPKNGCLLVNSVNEFGDKAQESILSEINGFAAQLNAIFMKKLKQDSDMEEVAVLKQLSFLGISLQGLCTASKSFKKEELDNYIEMTFSALQV